MRPIMRGLSGEQVLFRSVLNIEMSWCREPMRSVMQVSKADTNQNTFTPPLTLTTCDKNMLGPDIENPSTTET